MRLASRPTGRARLSLVLIATTDGSLSTMPWPRTYTSVFAVPRSMAMSRVASDIKLFAMWALAGVSGVYPAPASMSMCRQEAGPSPDGSHGGPDLLPRAYWGGLAGGGGEFGVGGGGG